MEEEGEEADGIGGRPRQGQGRRQQADAGSSESRGKKRGGERKRREERREDREGLTHGLHMSCPHQHLVSGPHRQFNIDCEDLNL